MAERAAGLAAVKIAPGRGPSPLAEELAAILEMKDPEARFSRLDLFWRRWFAADQEAVFAAVAGLPPGDERAQALNYTLMELAATEPDRALDLALDLVRDTQDAHLFSSLFDSFARKDLDAARARLARVPSGPAFDPSWRAFTDAAARMDLGEALRWARGLSEGPARAVAVETVLYTLSEKDPLEAFEVGMQNLVGEARDRSLYQALLQIIPRDPAGAAPLIMAMPASPQRELAVVDAARVWADEAPERALAWASSLPDEASAAEVLAVANILEIWAQKDGPAASAAVFGLPDGEARAAASERVAAVLAQASPEAALAWASTLPDAESQERALAASVGVWAQQDPAAAAAWAVEVNEGAGRDALLSAAVAHWALQDVEAAKRYVTGLGDDVLQRAGAITLAPQLAQSDPRAALDWASRLPLAAARDETTLFIYRQWLAEEPAAARAWALSSGLDLD